MQPIPKTTENRYELTQSNQPLADVSNVLLKIAQNISATGVDNLSDLELSEASFTLRHVANIVDKQIRPSNIDDASTEKLLGDVDLDLNKILVVDDIPEHIYLIKQFFKKENYVLLTASNVLEAVNIAKQELPGLVITDIQMPHLSGIDLLKSLKSDNLTKNIAVILITAHYLNSKDASKGLILGADDYIKRPFMRDEFMSRVDAVMRIKRAEAETRRQAKMVTQQNKRLQLVNELAVAVNSALAVSEIYTSSMQKLVQLLNVETVVLLSFQDDKRLIAYRLAHSEKEISKFHEAYISDHADNANVELYVQNVLAILNEKHGLDYIGNGNPIESIAMMSREQMIGSMTVIGKSGYSFDHDDLVVLNSVVTITAVAIANIRLLNNTQQEVDDLISLNNIGLALASTLNLKQILKQTISLVRQSLQAEAVVLWLLDEKNKNLHLTDSSNTHPHYSLHKYEHLAKYVFRIGEAYISGNLTESDLEMNQEFESATDIFFSALCVPIEVKGQVIGVMQALHSKIGWFRHHHLHFLYPVARSVGIALENARLFNKVQAFNQGLEQMVAERTAQLAEEKEKTEAILANMADGLLVLDADNQILTANVVAESMLNFRLNKLAQQSITSNKLQTPLWQSLYEVANQPQLTATADVDVPITETGKNLSIQAHSAKIKNDKGKITGTVIVLRDITAIKEVESMKASFMAGITHELQTPLSVINLHANNLISYGDRIPAEKRLDFLTSIQKQGELLGQLIRDILQLSNIDSGLLQLDKDEISLKSLVEKMVANLHPLAEAKQIELKWSPPETDVVTVADINQLEQLIRNLISNAIKYTPSEGFVEVGTELKILDGQQVALITVRDTGIGIPPEDQTRVFERFYRVDPSHTVPGTGLGLSIVKEIVSAHNGTIHLKSNIGQGSKFTVTLPTYTH